MAIGSSGYGTLTDQVGDLASVLERCTGAKILLVNPYSLEAQARIRAIADPDYTIEVFQEEVRRSIELLKRLRALGKFVRLKFYADPPPGEIGHFGRLSLVTTLPSGFKYSRNAGVRIETQPE